LVILPHYVVVPLPAADARNWMMPLAKAFEIAEEALVKILKSHPTL